MSDDECHCGEKIKKKFGRIPQLCEMCVADLTGNDQIVAPPSEKITSAPAEK
jgi:hypothetical protein